MRMVAGLVRQEIRSYFQDDPPLQGLGPVEVLFDANLGGRHAALWLPVARELARSGHEVGLASYRPHLPPDVQGRPELDDRSWFRFVSLPEVPSKKPHKRLPTLSKYRSALPWKGLFGLAMALWERKTDRLIEVWDRVLEHSVVKAVATTSPMSAWSNALVHASRRHGIRTVHLPQGFPMRIWQFSVCDLVLAWSRLGASLLRQSGWTDAQIILAHNPTVPASAQLQEFRISRRRELGLGEADLCALFMGQKSVDQVFFWQGYRETCGMVGRGLHLAMRSSNLIPLLRPHPMEMGQETERLLRNHGLQRLLVSREASLLKDLAAADVVISMNSAALEEAYLVRRPILQAVALGFDPILDFGVIGAPLVQTPKELAGLLTGREWLLAQRESPVYRPAAEEIREIVLS